MMMMMIIEYLIMIRWYCKCTDTFWGANYTAYPL